MDQSDIHSIILGVLTIAVTVLGGVFRYMLGEIRKVRDDMKEEIRLVNAQLNEKAGEHRQGQQQLWIELRQFEQRSADYRTAMQEKMSALPTREEMRQDLLAMEGRIQAMIRTGQSRDLTAGR